MKPSKVNLPYQIQSAITATLETKKLADIKNAYNDLSYKYKKQTGSYFKSIEHCLAYLSVRAPSTFGAIKNVLESLKTYSNFEDISSFLDAGAGPGCGLWAVIDNFEKLKQTTLIEKSNLISEIGKSILETSDYCNAESIRWIQSNLTNLNRELEPHDFVLASYSLGETPNYLEVAESLWKLTKKWLVIIEPGDPTSFERIKKIRNYLIEKGANLAAPCPHSRDCPLSENDWCHFSQKILRSEIHRKLKSGTLSYEEEKFSYLAFTRTGLPEKLPRVIKRPIKASGHILLDLCTSTNVKRRTVSKKNKEQYRAAKRISWGDTWGFI
jgi:ribosomal protein RSM22 (predicted rRNA methylase)|tara:strand:+ start:853 stop:1830 length:978 start_codon:yes stop_codon:yes gene_type:complete